MNNAAVLDTGFLISLVDRQRPNHRIARNYYKYFLEHGVVMLLPTIVAAEFSIV
jgi:predicted nucleic acid-binding protein